MSKQVLLVYCVVNKSECTRLSSGFTANFDLQSSSHTQPWSAV